MKSSELLTVLVEALVGHQGLRTLAQSATGNLPLIQTGVKVDSPAPDRLHVLIRSVAPLERSNAAAAPTRQGSVSTRPTWTVEVICCVAGPPDVRTEITGQATTVLSRAFALALDTADEVLSAYGGSGIGLVVVREMETDQWADTVAVRSVYEITARRR
ncbi:MAG: hypothetical protein EOM25_10665 [Deltaproteobacteria bacterium]|nr:hypothetical protein [Deltaproteobacteria bacterium]